MSAGWRWWLGSTAVGRTPTEKAEQDEHCAVVRARARRGGSACHAAPCTAAMHVRRTLSRTHQPRSWPAPFLGASVCISMYIRSTQQDPDGRHRLSGPAERVDLHGQTDRSRGKGRLASWRVCVCCGRHWRMCLWRVVWWCCHGARCVALPCACQLTQRYSCLVLLSKWVSLSRVALAQPLPSSAPSPPAIRKATSSTAGAGASIRAHCPRLLRLTIQCE